MFEDQAEYNLVRYCRFLTIAAKGTTIIIVEQNVPMIFGMADQCIFLENGRVVASGTTEEIENSDAVERHLTI